MLNNPQIWTQKILCFQNIQKFEFNKKKNPNGHDGPNDAMSDTKNI